MELGFGTPCVELLGFYFIGGFFWMVFLGGGGLGERLLVIIGPFCFGKLLFGPCSDIDAEVFEGMVFGSTDD